MAPFSGHHMKICFINHCCPMKQKSNHRWECALKVSYAWQLWSRVCSYPGKPNMSHPLGSCARTGRNLIGNFLLEAQGNAHTALEHSADLEHCALLWDLKNSALPGLCPLQQPLAWAGQRGQIQYPPCRFGLALTPKGGHCFTVSTGSDISPLMHT